MADLRGALLVGGTSSDAGKSLLVAGLCRSLARRGISVAPFKAQNMSNNSAVTLDGGEIGRAQALQAAACGLEPVTRFNPVLLKPGSDRRSQVVVRGRAVGDVGAGDYQQWRRRLAEVVHEELASLRADYDVVLAEGAGSIAEINLRRTDLANLGLARRAGIPVLVVADIDRGGALAGLYGTTAVLEPADQALVAGYVINKFRGDPAILAPGLEMLRERTGRDTLGVIPMHPQVWIDAEDSLASPVGRRVGGPPAPYRGERLTVAAIRLPRVSNSTDVEALACEAGVDVTWVDDPGAVHAADLVVLPGTRATVDDLRWLRERGLAQALVERAAGGLPILGICGGFQMLSRQIDDHVESSAGAVDGLGLLDVHIVFAQEKTLRHFTGDDGRHPVHGYEIHHGRVAACREQTWLNEHRTGPEGARRGAVYGTHGHGLLESDDFRRAFLTEVAAAAGRPGFTPAPDLSVAAVRQGQLDLLADLVDTHLDMSAVQRLLADGPPALPSVLSWLSWNPST
ncbi:cobyric acid synthase [Gordonia hirsuta DSM 44140 = NBRC 16056]|uniref:Cobyric acid synthase n=1 Tax=Gordonia hirsuta DSM 44140 = NBRC 16056 TaxID=1121927 RepID=L7LD30_9ACTN|nr:cobyric acid synthase [Gordonia hirsuta]GAC58656.1 cobyric acid synthase [Gordonia hirsuta DSM 44140 = NBRC 16056]